MQSISSHKQTQEQSQGASVSHALPQDLDRHTALRVWLMTSGNTITALSSLVGISQSALSWGLKQETMPVRSHELLVEAGVPAPLLPRPEDIPWAPPWIPARQKITSALSL